MKNGKRVPLSVSSSGSTPDNNILGLSSPEKSSPRRKRHSSYVGKNDENKIRGNWSGKLDFLLSCLSFAVGLGNVWRFPYQCYRNGGGAFVLPFIIMLGVAGIPLFFLETAFGQFASSGVISIWKASPIFQGIGAGMFLVSFFVSIYYNVIIAWTFLYLFSSFTSQLPWETCDNAWNTPACRAHVYDGQEKNTCENQNGTWLNESCYLRNYTDFLNDNSTHFLTLDVNEGGHSNSLPNGTKSPSDEFFHRYILGISDGFHDMGAPRWQLVLCLLLAWTIIAVAMIKGIKSSGRVVYFTATFPYVVLVILLIRGITLPGSGQGILFYVTPRWEKLLTAQVWADAAVQIFFSLAPGWGGLITLSSYNKFKNNCLRDAYIVTVGDCLTSLFAGLVIFSIIGFMAHELNTDIDKVLDEGPGLAFIVYPEVVTRLPVSPLWAILFFLMLITLGVGTQFALINTIHTTIMDVFPKFFRIGFRPSYLMAGLCLLNFILGLSMCTPGGMYMLQLMDAYSASYSVLIIALTESFALSWVYGFDQLQANIKLMLGKSIGLVWKISWKFVSPLALVGICLFQLIEFKSNSYRGYVFPAWAEAMGWCISLSAILCIPGAALFKIFTQEQDLPILQRIKKLSKPTDDWGPGLFRSTDITEGTKPVDMMADTDTNDEAKEVTMPLNGRATATFDLNPEEKQTCEV